MMPDPRVGVAALFAFVAAIARGDVNSAIFWQGAVYGIAYLVRVGYPRDDKEAHP